MGEDPFKNGGSKETKRQKVARVHASVSDALNTIGIFYNYAGFIQNEEEYQKIKKELLGKEEIIPYMEYIKTSYPKTTQEEINNYYEEFDQKVKDFIKAVKLPETTREDVIKMYRDILSYISPV